ncbi:hypothetical protein ABZZ49_39705, partial [Streptomyces zaomyceticus]
RAARDAGLHASRRTRRRDDWTPGARRRLRRRSLGPALAALLAGVTVGGVAVAAVDLPVPFGNDPVPAPSTPVPGHDGPTVPPRLGTKPPGTTTTPAGPDEWPTTSPAHGRHGEQAPKHGPGKGPKSGPETGPRKELENGSGHGSGSVANEGQRNAGKNRPDKGLRNVPEKGRSEHRADRTRP